MSSPRSSWTGSISLGLLAVPISVAPASSEIREKSLKTLCACHHKPVDRSERCLVTGEDIDSKVHGVEKNEFEFHVLAEPEVQAIEDSTKSNVLEILDAQPLEDLPLAYTTGAYFVRAEKDNRVAAQSMAILIEAMKESGLALISKWCSRSVQRLVVLREQDGLLLMEKLPMANELREPGKQETAHFDIEVPGKAVKMAIQLFNQTKSKKGFDHSAYTDEGLTMRQNMVDRVLAGDVPEGEEPKEQQQQEVPDIMETLMASIDETKEG